MAERDRVTIQDPYALRLAREENARRGRKPRNLPQTVCDLIQEGLQARRHRLAGVPSFPDTPTTPSASAGAPISTRSEGVAAPGMARSA